MACGATILGSMKMSVPLSKRESSAAAVNMAISGLQVKAVPHALPASYTFKVPQPSRETPFGSAVVVQWLYHTTPLF